jgi:AmmeMemoRadiSam system protein B
MNMNRSIYRQYLATLILLIITSSALSQVKQAGIRVRQPVDTVGFASHAYQMDSVMNRITRLNRLPEGIKMNLNSDSPEVQKAAICPHDDYIYAGWLYPLVLKNIQAHTIIFIGVAHKAKKFNVEDKMVFDSFTEWKEPYGNVRVSGLRDDIIKNIPTSYCLVHDSLQAAEHSVEAIIPFLQYKNRKMEIISILIPYMSFETMDLLSAQLASAIERVMKARGLKWGRDVAIVMSTDAVHYGDKDWGGSNYALYGCDNKGYAAATAHEMEIINGTLCGSLNPDKAIKFSSYTLDEKDYKSYKWTWCGRYSVPFGLLTIMKMQMLENGMPLEGRFTGYGTSLDEPRINVTDIGMGKTADATLHHWVGYAGVCYY